MQAKISVVIPTFERSEQLEKLLISLKKSCLKEIAVEILCVANPDLSLAQKRNYGYSQSNGDFILFIDDDNELTFDVFQNLIMVFNDERVGIAGLTACYKQAPNRICDAGANRFLISGFTSSPFFNWYYMDMLDRTDGCPYEVDEAANAFMVRREVFRKIGWFDEKRFPIDLDEADFCLRAKQAGYKVIYVPRAVTYHNSFTFSRLPDFRRIKNAFYVGRNRILFQKKHLTPIQFFIFLVIFLWLFILLYCLSLVLRRKFLMIFYFLKGVWYGLTNNTTNIY